MLVTKSFTKTKQYFISIFLIITSSLILFYSSNFIGGYQVVALILLLLVSISAMLFDILPVLVTAILSALIWNFFFIPPLFDFKIDTTEDFLMFLMYFVIALINAVLTFKIREVEAKSRNQEEKEKTIKLYNTLLNSLSHELRTPISTIIGSIDTINENKKISDKNRIDLYKEIEKASMRLNRQVENLLSMSKLESGVLKPKLDWCDVNELIFSVIKDNQNDSNDHVIEFTADENLPLFKLDREFLKQILHNIIINSLQYTPHGSTITIIVGYISNACVIIITDDGNGFPENEISRVFDKFYRLPSSATGGTGLGLSIAKGFVESMGGTIRLKNTDIGGAQFIVKIPADTVVMENLDNE